MLLQEIPLAIQTGCAELIDQLRIAGVSAYPEGSTFRKRLISGRNYWYAQEPTRRGERPPERYVGPETPALTASIEAGRRAKVDADARRTVVKALIGAGLSTPDALTGALLEALAAAGFFRLRGVIVGTVAFQTYSGLLGVRLPGAALQTADLDLAQDYGISVAIDDALGRPLLEVLREVDPDFEPVTHITDPTLAAVYARPGGYRVDILTTHRGAERDAPSKLPSARSDAVALRFLDFLLRDTIEAAVLHRFGVLVRVPAPQRYAIHKLIVATQRQTHGTGSAKSDKDIRQAETLIHAFALKRRGLELQEAFEEARARGPGWRKRLDAGLKRLEPESRALLLGG